MSSTGKSAEELAAEYEKTGGPDNMGAHGKRPKAEQAEHKHHAGDDTRKIVNNAMNGEQKRKDAPK